MGTFCGHCGSPVGTVKFCGKCGARLPDAPAFAPVASVTQASSTIAPAASPALPQPTAKGSNALAKILWTFLALFLLFILAAMGSCAYIAYRAKKKADEIQQAYKSNDLNKLAGALGVGSSNGDSNSSSGSSRTATGSSSASAPLSFPSWKPAAAGREFGIKVPLRQGLTVVTAVAQFGGDYESIKQVQQVTTSSVRLSYRADNVPNPLDGLQKLSGEKAPKASGTISGQRVIRNQDLQTAHDYMQWFSPNQPEVMPGTTAISISREVLAELKEKGETPFSFRAGGFKGMAGSLLGALGEMAGEERQAHPKK